MIDTHCHLEQPDYHNDRDQVIARCQKKLHALVTSCANPPDFELTIALVKQYRDFVFATASIHPRYIKEISNQELRNYVELIQSNRRNLVAIGETGLDYNWITDVKGREKQKQLLVTFITLAKKLQLPLVIHSRDATEEVVTILEEEKAKAVQMHMFTSRSLLKQVIDNGWLISVNTLLLRSKNVKKIIRDCPLEQLMLETDSPWLGISEDGNIKPKGEVRNEPTAVYLVAKEIARIKKIDVGDVDEQTTNNARDFFKFQL